MTNIKDMTNGKVSGSIMGFFTPLLFTNLLQQIYSFADTAIVGKGLGDNALAAVGNMSSLTFLITGFSSGLANGFAVIISQHFGAKEYDKLRKNIGSTIRLSAFITLLLTVISILFLKNLMLLMRTPSIIIRDSLTYGYILFGGLFVTVSYNLLSGILRALGDSTTPFHAIVIAAFINVLLDCIFIFLFHTNVAGAAIATIISEGISAFICYRKLKTIDIIRITINDIKKDTGISHDLLKNGIPMALMNSITAIGCIVIQYYVNSLGISYASAYSACSKYLNMFMLPGVTAGYTMSAFTSQNSGAGRFDRIRESVHISVRIIIVFYLILGSVMVFLPKSLAAFMLNGADALSLAVEFLPICGIMLFTVDLLFIYRSCVQGMGYPAIPMASGILEMLLRVIVIALLLPVIGFKAAALAEVTAWSGALIMNYISYVLLIHNTFPTPISDSRSS